MTISKPCDIHLNMRWLIRRDLPEVMDIEDSTDNPWSVDDFVNALKSRDCTGMVADSGGKVVGYIVYQFAPKSYKVINIAVAAGMRRRGVATAMIDRLKRSMNNNCFRNEIKVACYDDNLPFHLFLKANGFTCYRVIDDRYKFKFRKNA